MDKRNIVLGLALAGLVSAGSSIAKAEHHDEKAAGASAEKNHCNAKDHCKGKKAEKNHCNAKDHCKGKAADKNSCSAKDSCNGKAEEVKAESK